jgi:hypothetical protein
MARFSRPLTVTKIDKDVWVVEIPFRYYIGDETTYIDVLDGTLTDFASVPRIFWPLIPKDGRHTQAAVLHDFLYKSHLKSKEEADKIFLEAMGVLGVKPWRQQIMYWSVVLFGKSAWDSYSKKP